MITLEIQYPIGGERSGLLTIREVPDSSVEILFAPGNPRSQVEKLLLTQAEFAEFGVAIEIFRGRRRWIDHEERVARLMAEGML